MDRSMPDEHTNDADNRAYWRGRTDTRLDNIDARLCKLENTTHITNTKLEHIHVCIEKRSRILSMLTGGLAVLYVLLQIVTPLILRLIARP